MEPFQPFVRTLQAHAATMPPADGRLFLVGCAGFPLACLVHLVSGILFWYLGYITLALWEIGATTLWILMWIGLLQRRIFALALWLPLFVEIPLRAALTTYYLGFESGHWLFCFVPLVLIPFPTFFSPVIKAVLTAYIFAAVALIAGISTVVPPAAPPEPGWQIFFLVSNILSVATVLALVLFLLQFTVLRAEAALEREFERAEGLLKTIGDAYMAVVGVPDARTSHASIAVNMALDMLEAARRVSARAHFPIELRIGVNSGPVVAGVIGTSKFAFDLWGDAVNVAARMETHSAPGMVLVTETTAGQLGAAYDITPEGTREVKGKGTLAVCSVRAAASGTVAAL